MSYDLAVTLDGEPITNRISNLSFKSVDPGGFASVTFDLAKPIDAADIDPFAQVEVTDAATGEVVGGGRVLQPGRGVDASGEVWSLSALGEGLAHMDETTQPYVVIDKNLDGWAQSYVDNKKLSWTTGSPPGAVEVAQGLMIQSDTGTLAFQSEASMTYYPIFNAMQLLGGYSLKFVAGAIDTNNRIRVRARRDVTNIIYTQISDDPFSTTLVTRAGQVGVNWSVSDDYRAMVLRFARIGASGPADETTWAHFRDVRVSAMRYDRTGTPIDAAGAYANEYVWASDVVTDLWARFCPRFDLLNATIDQGEFQFDQLAWPTGIKPSGVMDELLAAEPGFTWHVWERQANGKWRAEFIERPTAVRYEITAFDGFSAPGGTGEHLNEVWVTGKDVADRPAALRVTGIDSELDAEGLIRSATIDLGSEVFSPTTAQRVGEQAIADSMLVSTGASVTVARKVLDLYTGRWVKPYQILPGHLCRVRGVKPTAATLTPEGAPDGSSLFRIVSNTYSTDSASSALELNSYSVTESKAIAELVRKRTRQ